MTIQTAACNVLLTEQHFPVSLPRLPVYECTCILSVCEWPWEYAFSVVLVWTDEKRKCLHNVNSHKTKQNK